MQVSTLRHMFKNWTDVLGRQRNRLGNENAQCTEASVVEASRCSRSQGKSLLPSPQLPTVPADNHPGVKSLRRFVIKQESPTISIRFCCHFEIFSERNQKKVALHCVRSRTDGPFP